MIKVWPHTPVGRRMILGSPGTEHAEHAKAEAPPPSQGKEGTALSAMRPRGQTHNEGTLSQGFAIEHRPSPRPPKPP